MTAVKMALVLLSALVLQAAVVSQLGLFGAHGDLLILVPVAAGLTLGAERGALAGFVAGIAVDLLVTTPFGLTALAYSLVGYGVGAFQHGVLRPSWWQPFVAAVGGASLGTAAWALAATVFGVEGLLDEQLLRILAAVAVVAGVLVVPAIRIARWVEGEQASPYATGAR